MVGLTAGVAFPVMAWKLEKWMLPIPTKIPGVVYVFVYLIARKICENPLNNFSGLSLIQAMNYTILLYGANYCIP